MEDGFPAQPTKAHVTHNRAEKCIIKFILSLGPQCINLKLPILSSLFVLPVILLKVLCVWVAATVDFCENLVLRDIETVISAFQNFWGTWPHSFKVAMLAQVHSLQVQNSLESSTGAEGAQQGRVKVSLWLCENLPQYYWSQHAPVPILCWGSFLLLQTAEWLSLQTHRHRTVRY